MALLLNANINCRTPFLPNFFFFFNDTATTEIYTLSLHDALPISTRHAGVRAPHFSCCGSRPAAWRDRKSTRLNSSHMSISYAVLCLKKKNKNLPPLRSSQVHHVARTPEPGLGGAAPACLA